MRAARALILVLFAAGCGGAMGAPAPRGGLRCPARVRGRAVPSRGSGLAAALVPAGARRARLCFYAGLNPRPQRYGFLRTSRSLTDTTRVAALAAMLNRLPAVRQGVSTCPGLQAGPAVVLFAYRHRPVVAVTVYVPNTCFLVSNGHRVRQANGGTIKSLLRFR